MELWAHSSSIWHSLNKCGPLLFGLFIQIIQVEQQSMKHNGHIQMFLWSLLVYFQILCYQTKAKHLYFHTKIFFVLQQKLVNERWWIRRSEENLLKISFGLVVPLMQDIAFNFFYNCSFPLFSVHCSSLIRWSKNNSKRTLPINDITIAKVLSINFIWMATFVHVTSLMCQTDRTSYTGCILKLICLHVVHFVVFTKNWHYLLLAFLNPPSIRIK